MFKSIVGNWNLILCLPVGGNIIYIPSNIPRVFFSVIIDSDSLPFLSLTRSFRYMALSIYDTWSEPNPTITKEWSSLRNFVPCNQVVLNDLKMTRE
jgi:hypothetical protein